MAELMEEPDEYGLPNLTLLSEVNDKTIVDNLKLRFERKKAYTFAGDVIISVNPYHSLQTTVDEEDSFAQYLGKEVFDRPPHIYTAVDLAYLDLRHTNKDCCIVFNGMCGAGKTEAAKKAMRYLANLSEEGKREEKVQNLLINSNVILESFGNATTPWNDNSSRFGKCIQVSFNFSNAPVGGRVDTHLLEISRVVCHRMGDRNFRCFYQLLMGASDSILGDLELERDPSCYHYLEKDKEGEGLMADVDHRHSFEAISNAMKLLHFTDEDQSDIRKTLGAILHLGNLIFEDLPQESTDNGDTDKKQIERVAKLLGTSYQSILEYLMKGLSLAQNGEQVEMTKVTQKEFEIHRDELAMVQSSVW